MNRADNKYTSDLFNILEQISDFNNIKIETLLKGVSQLVRFFNEIKGHNHYGTDYCGRSLETTCQICFEPFSCDLTSLSCYRLADVDTKN